MKRASNSRSAPRWPSSPGSPGRFGWQPRSVFDHRVRWSDIESELAKRVHLSASACSERLRVLQAAGIIEGFYARLSPALVGGIVFVMVEVVLDRHRLDL
ncbi:Lrp/AsnC family transcriptional regulator [Mesorhizobium sp. M0674]|uniref:Lrp/AsnC family transcriptional regulator n=1 Tax=unclassified Mesorhizobium TaxID=325217 RepID=UPI00333722A9